MDTYADDLATLIEKVDLKRATLIGFSGPFAALQGPRSGPFFGFNRPGAKVSQVSETDFTEDLKKFEVPTLILHGDDDQIVPIGAAALASSKLVRNANLKVYAQARPTA